MLAYVMVNMMIAMNTYKTEQIKALHMSCSIFCVCILHITRIDVNHKVSLKISKR